MFFAGIIQHDWSEAAVFLLIYVILDPLLFTLASEKEILVCISLCVQADDVLFIQSVTYKGRCENPEVHPDRGI